MAHVGPIRSTTVALRIADEPLNQHVLSSGETVHIEAIWFLFMDTVTRLLLYMPTVLGEGFLFREHGANAGELVSSETTLMYSGVHGLVFILLGVTAAFLNVPDEGVEGLQNENRERNNDVFIVPWAALFGALLPLITRTFFH
jgi:hypothetical protein